MRQLNKWRLRSPRSTSRHAYSERLSCMAILILVSTHRQTFHSMSHVTCVTETVPLTLIYFTLLVFPCFLLLAPKPCSSSPAAPIFPVEALHWSLFLFLFKSNIHCGTSHPEARITFAMDRRFSAFSSVYRVSAVPAETPCEQNVTRHTLCLLRTSRYLQEVNSMQLAGTFPAGASRAPHTVHVVRSGEREQRRAYALAEIR